MKRISLQSICALVVALVLGWSASAQVQFQVPLTVTNGTTTQPLVIGVSGDGPGGVINDNTIGADTDSSLFGAYTEELAPPPPPAPFAFDCRILTLPGRDATFPVGLGSGVYKDFRGWDSFLQVDSFRVFIDGDDVDVNPTVVKWPGNLADYGSAWVIKPQTGSEWGPVDMLALDSVVIPAGVLQKNIIIIKTGAGPAGPVFSLAPNFLNFGAVPVGSSSASQSVSVLNASTTNTLTVNVVPNVNYNVVPSGAAIPAGTTQTFDITFTPTAPGPGGNLTFNHNGPGPSSVLVVAAAGSDTSKFLTVTPDTIIAKEGGKFLKSAKRGKGLAPNWANLLEEVVVQGGFQPNSSTSDSAGGLVIGVSAMDNVGGGKWKPNKAASASRGWVRLTKWDPIKGGKGYNALQKTLEDKTAKHTVAGTVRGFDTFANGKPFVKQQKSLPPKKQANKLFAEVVALKFNIAASQLGKTPVGFGELIFDRDSNTLCDELSVLAIAEKADSMLTFWQGESQEDFDSLYSAIYDINRAFVGAIDTVTFETGSKLLLKGITNSTTYLKSPLVFRPIVLAPTTDRTEEVADFDYDEEFDEDSMSPMAVKLYQNYPNPFNPATTITFRLVNDADVTVRVYNAIGQEVASLLENEELEGGINTVSFNAINLASGVYFYKVTGKNLETGENLIPVTGKMLLMK